MKNRKRLVTVCFLSAIFVLIAAQPLLAAEKIIRIVVPGCE